MTKEILVAEERRDELEKKAGDDTQAFRRLSSRVATSQGTAKLIIYYQKDYQRLSYALYPMWQRGPKP